jgi:ribokinase
MTTDGQRLTIIGDIGVDLVLGPIAGWPQPGTETLMERSELRAGGSAGNAALAVSYLGGHSRLLSVVGSDDLGTWLRDQLRGLGACLEVCDAPTTLSVGLLHSWGEPSATGCCPHRTEAPLRCCPECF